MTDTFFSQLAGQFDEATLDGVAGATGLTRETIGSAFSTATPATLSALSAKASQPESAAGLMRTFGILTSMGSSKPATMISGLLNDPKAMNAGLNMARSLFGDSFGLAKDNLVARTGISDDLASKVLGTLAPAIMGAVGTKVKSSGMDVAGLSDFMKGGVEAIAQTPEATRIGTPIAAAVAVNAPEAPTALVPPVAPDAPVAPAAPEAPAVPAVAAAPSDAGAIDLNMDRDATAALAGKLGLPEGTVQQLAPVVVAFVLMALGRKAKQPDGLKQIGTLIDQAGQTQTTPAEYVKQADPAKNAEVLGQLIGENTLENVSDNFGRKMGITSEQAAGMLGVGVPVVLNQLAHVQNSLGTDTEGLANFIAEKAGDIKNTGEMTYILDNVPGISDNVKRGLRKLFGRS